MVGEFITLIGGAALIAWLRAACQAQRPRAPVGVLMGAPSNAIFTRWAATFRRSRAWFEATKMSQKTLLTVVHHPRSP
jgi:hypothetical protein